MSVVCTCQCMQYKMNTWWVMNFSMISFDCRRLIHTQSSMNESSLHWDTRWSKSINQYWQYFLHGQKTKTNYWAECKVLSFSWSINWVTSCKNYQNCYVSFTQHSVEIPFSSYWKTSICLFSVLILDLLHICILVFYTCLVCNSCVTSTVWSESP